MFFLYLINNWIFLKFSAPLDEVLPKHVKNKKLAVDGIIFFYCVIPLPPPVPQPRCPKLIYLLAINQHCYTLALSEIYRCFPTVAGIMFLSSTSLTLRNQNIGMNRSSRPEVFCKKTFLWNFIKFTWKHLCQSLFFNKAAGWRLQRLWHSCFPVNFEEQEQEQEHLRRPLLNEEVWTRSITTYVR